MTAATGAWAQEADYDIDVDFANSYDRIQTNFNCMIMGSGAEIKGTLDLSVDGDSKGSFEVNDGMVSGFIDALDAGDYTYSAVFKPEGGGSFSKNGDFTIGKAYTSIIYYGSTSINLGVGESTELEVYMHPDGQDGLSYSSSDASVASITKKDGYTYIIQAKAAGTATITLSYAGNTNYEAAEDKTITVTTAIDVTANEGATGEYWATYYNSAQGYTADANTTVYQAAVNSGKTAVVLTEVTGREIPAGKGVVLKSSAATITLTPTTTTQTLEGNELTGVDVATAAPSNAYCLSKETTGSARGVGFYTYTGTIPAHRAYLVVAGGPSNARGFLGFGDDDNTTGISLPEAVVIENDGPIYDLSGRRIIGQPQKGIYVKNGKKVVIK